MKVHLVDGTYELFRHYFALPDHLDEEGVDIGAVRGVVRSVIGLLEEGVTHIGVATDSLVESFRNQLWGGYKTGDDMDPVLWAQFPLLEESLSALGVEIWRGLDLEADDMLASAVAVALADERVDEIVICTPDKDLAQCVSDPRVVQFDRRAKVRYDETGVREKFGVGPKSIPDWLALVGDAADGFPGLPGWGAKSAAAVLSRYEHIEAIPASVDEWDVPVRGAAKLAATLVERRVDAELFKVLAQLRIDGEVGSVDDWRWIKPKPEFESWVSRFDQDDLLARVEAITVA